MAKNSGPFTDPAYKIDPYSVLARLEGEIAFTTLLRRLPNLRLANPDAALQWRPAFELRGLASLPVTW